ncbi:MAG TPA: PEP-CTERM sorting domain-containing protein [Methylomirabilota bacterium]|jgi:hypothetical protein
MIATAVAISAVDVHAFASSSSRRSGGGGGGGDSTTSASASVPEPSTLYAVGSGLVLLGGAGWLIRRRK